MSKKKKGPVKKERGPLILALETATDVSSVALFEGGKLIALQDYHAHKLHAKLMTVLIEQVLTNLDLKPRDLAAVAISQGPGSYTGLRVGVSVAKGLAMALQIPILSVGSLESLAYSVLDLAQSMDALIIPMLDARRMEVFCGIYGPKGDLQEQVVAKIIEEDAFAELLSQRKVIFVGDGVSKCREILSRHENAVLLDHRLSSAAHSGAVAWKKFQQEEFEDLVTFEPFYLKNYVATVSKKKLL